MGVSNGREVARVVELWRYPVKSMAGERLDEVEVGWNGLVGDRRWAFLRPDVPRSGFPWLTIRERALLCHYQPSFRDPTRPNASDVWVRTPSGRELEIIDPELAAEVGEGARALKQDRGIFDTMTLSLVSTQSLRSLGERVGAALDVRRFRPNVVIEATSDLPFPEEEWVGMTLRIGSTFRARIDKRDGRCVIVNIDPDTLERSASVLRTIAQERATFFGVYGSTVVPGNISVGDPVVIEGLPFTKS